MEGKFINRYASFCKSLSSLEQAKKRDLEDDFILSGTVQKFNLTFDISWKVMKDILIKYHGIQDFSAGSPRETLRAAYSVNLIDDDTWLDMLSDRNDLAHDYDGKLAETCVVKIITVYEKLFCEFRDRAEIYIEKMKKM